MEPDNLPALAQRIGGDLPNVLRWEQHALLPRQVQYAISAIVRGNPDLNTVTRVDMIAELVSFHGEHIDREIEELLAEHGAELVYLSVDWLYEDGWRDRSGGNRDDLRLAVQMIDRLQAAGVDASTTEAINVVVVSLGGFEEARQMDTTDIIDALAPTRSGRGGAEEGR